MQKLIFWRHGQTDQNLAGRIQGVSDVPLNDTGRAQARRAAPSLAQLQPTKIYVSDLSRARETACVLSELCGVEPVVDTRLRERGYGVWEGLTQEEIRDRWPQEWVKWGNGEDPGAHIGIESRTACGERVAHVVREVSSESADDDVIVFVAHGGCIVSGIITLLELDPSAWNGINGMDNCHWALMVPRPGAHIPWRLRAYNRFYGDVE